MEGSRFFYTKFIFEFSNHEGAESRACEVGFTVANKYHTRRYIRYACGLKLQRALYGEQAKTATAEAISETESKRGRESEEDRQGCSPGCGVKGMVRAETEGTWQTG